MACSGIISSTPSKPQNDGGKLGHTIKTLMFGPRGGKEAIACLIGELGFSGGNRKRRCRLRLAGEDVESRIW